MTQIKSNVTTPAKKRRQRIGNTVFHVKSVFIGQRELDDAMKNIVMRKMEAGRLPVAE